MKKEEIYRMTFLLNKEVADWKTQITDEIINQFNKSGFINPTNYVIVYNHFRKQFGKNRMVIPMEYIASNKGKVQLYYELANLDKAFMEEVLATIVSSEVVLEMPGRRSVQAVFIAYQDKLKYKREFYKVEFDGFGRKSLLKDDLLSARTHGFEDQLFRSAFTMPVTPN